MKKNSFGQGLAVFLVVIGIFYIIGAIGEASEPKEQMFRYMYWNIFSVSIVIPMIRRLLTRE